MPHRNHATAYSCVQEGSATQNPEPAVVKLVGEELSVTILVHREPMGPTAPRLVRWVGWCWARPSCWCCRCLWWRKGDVPCVVVSDGDVLGDAVDDGDVLGVDDVVAVPEPGQLPPSHRELPLPDGVDGELPYWNQATCRALWIDLSLHKCTCLSFFFARLSVCRARCVQTPALLALTTSTAGFHLSVLFLSTIIFDAKSAAVHWLACTLFVCLEALFELHSGNGAIVTTGHIATMSTDSVTVSLAIKGRRWSKK